MMVVTLFFWKKCMALSLKQRKIRYNPYFLRRYGFGRVAQLVEHYLDMVVVGGSNPLVATIFLFSRLFGSSYK